MLNKLKNKFKNLQTKNKIKLLEKVNFFSMFITILSIATYLSLSIPISLLGLVLFFIPTISSEVKLNDLKKILIEEEASLNFNVKKDNYDLKEENMTLNHLQKNNKNIKWCISGLIIFLIIITSLVNPLNFGIAFSLITHILGYSCICGLVKIIKDLDYYTKVQEQMIEKFNEYELIKNRTSTTKDINKEKNISNKYTHDSKRSIEISISSKKQEKKLSKKK